MIHQMIFAVLAMVVLGSAIMVVTLRNIVHCAVFLVFTFLGVAGIYVALNAEFLFAAQIMIYVGAISVLILFGVMLTQELTSKSIRVTNGNVVLSLLAAVSFFLVLLMELRRTWGGVTDPGPALRDTTPIVGKQLLTTYLLPFELASLLLLIAMVGAIVMAMLSDRPEPGRMANPSATDHAVAPPANAEANSNGKVEERV